MKKFTLLVLLIIQSPILLAKDVYLTIGETHSVATQRLQTLKIEKKGIVSIKDHQDYLVFTGKKIGKTHVLLGSQTFTLHVLKKKHKETLKQLVRWHEGKRGPEIRVEENQLKVAGRLLDSDDFFSLTRFTTSDSEFQLQSSVAPQVQEQIDLKIQRILSDQNLFASRVLFEPYWHIQIQNEFKKDLIRYQKVLRPLGIQAVVDSHQLTQVPVIEIKVYIAHIKKNFLREWGVEWPSQVSTTVLSSHHMELQTFQTSLKALETHGQGQVLASPTLLTESGKTGEFHSGGEFPVRTTTQFNNNVQWKRYGLFLKTKPTANTQKHLQIDIDIELSTLDQNMVSDGVPALVRSHIKTQVNLKRPQPILVSGFLKEEMGRGASGLPWLQQIPIFKPLFSTQQIFNDELDLVFILVPGFYES